MSDGSEIILTYPEDGKHRVQARDLDLLHSKVLSSSRSRLVPAPRERRLLQRAPPPSAASWVLVVLARACSQVFWGAHASVFEAVGVHSASAEAEHTGAHDSAH